MKKLAIVFFHMGYSDYQWCTLDLAVKRCPGADVFLITDRPKEKYPDGVKIVDMSVYNAIIQEFDSVYTHRNTCPRMFNFRGIVRWLVYNAWWHDHKEYDLFVADSDVMIFSDLSEEAKRWKEYSHTLSMGTAGGQSFWFAVEDMDALADLIWTTYLRPLDEGPKKILSHYDNLQAAGKKGGVCDMTFLKANAERVGNVGETTDIVGGAEIDEEAATFDHNILMAEKYEFDQGRKVVRWRKGNPYCELDKTNGIIVFPVRFNTLHMSCSGALIKDFYEKATA